MKDKEVHLATVKKQLDMKSQESNREIQEYKTKFQKTGQEHARQAVDLQKDLDRLRLENSSLTHELGQTRGDLNTAKERTRELVAANQALVAEQEELR